MKVLTAASAVLLLSATLLAQGGKKVDIVSVTGCLREQADGQWHLVAATEPVTSSAVAPPKSELPTVPPAGTQRYHLIGVREFALPTHKDKTLVVKGLLIKDSPDVRLNITSVTEALPQCAAMASK